MLHTQWSEAAIFRPTGRSSLAHQITDQLRRRIVAGDLAAGRRLPSIRRLASLYGVSVPTIESAVHALVTLGLVRVSRGVGVFVTRPTEQTILAAYAWRNADVRELGTVRASIDERAPALVAQRVHDQPTPRLPRRLFDINLFAVERAMQRESPEQFVRADLAFHGAIAESLRGNELTASVYETVAERLTPSLIAVADVMAADQRLQAAHVALTAAILDGRVLAAARLGRLVAGVERAALDRGLG